MKPLIVLLVLFGFTYGRVEFHSIYKDKTKIPDNRKSAIENDKWGFVQADDNLKIDWYKSPESDFYVQLAFDGLGVLAGARLAIPNNGVNEFYTKSKLFKEKTISGTSYYIATVLFTDKDILKGAGREKTVADEIVQLILVDQKEGEPKRIKRVACDVDKEIFSEGGCRKNYGLVFSPFKEGDETCDFPFFVVYDEDGKGNMLGFGWVAPASDIPGSKALSTQDITELFPSKPNCLTGKAAVNIWLAKDYSENESCEEKKGKFVENRCQIIHAPRDDNL